MVLVAALAAGVLINTSGYLQSKSEAASQQAGRQTTNRLLVTSAVGEHMFPAPASDYEYIGSVNVSVKQSPGANNINLSLLTVTWVGPSGSYKLVHESADAANADGEFVVVALKDADGSAPVINDPDDRMVLVFDLENDDVPGVDHFGKEIHQGNTVEVTLTTRAGATTQKELVVPESLSGESAVLL